MADSDALVSQMRHRVANDLALIVTASVGAIFAGLSLVGGLVGASLGARR